MEVGVGVGVDGGKEWFCFGMDVCVRKCKYA